MEGIISKNDINIINVANTARINIYVIKLSNILVDVIPNLLAFDGILISSIVKLKFNPTLFIKL